MGQEYSTEDGNGSPSVDGSQGAFIEGETSFDSLSGYRVMKVFQGSPASRSGLSPYEDFVVALNGRLVNADNASLANVLRENEGKEVALIVWNCIDSKKRDVSLRPVKWNGPGLLGAAVRFEGLRGAADHVQRVIDVLPNSPADEAGLVPLTDYIVGTPAEAFRKEADFNKLISDALQRQTAASVMMFSSATNRTRNIEIRPNKDWGGEGSLGCELATGLLHHISRST
ncbi:unnamed protein product [Agarophyton chilense]